MAVRLVKIIQLHQSSTQAEFRIIQCQAIDHAVGIELSCDVGEWVEVGQELALLHVHDPQAADATAARVRAAMVIDPEAAKDDNSRSIVIDRVCAH